MKRNTPTRIVETGRAARGSSGQGVGWLHDLANRARNIRASIVGIHERLTSPLQDGVPGCANGEMRFQADQDKTISIAQFPTDPDDIVTPALLSPLLVNPIILSGQTYTIPITFPPPGVFQAHNLVVGIEAGFTMFANQNRPGLTPLADYRQTPPNGDAAYGGFVSGAPDERVIRYTWQQQVLGNFAQVMPFLPFVWNILDEKSGRPLAQDWIPSGALLNTRGNAGSSTVEQTDGEFFEFDVPWIFERDGQVSFLFRPLMDLYQIAAADAQRPYVTSEGAGINDLTGGRRFEEAILRVEFHGNRYYTSQDVLKDGARLTNARDPSQGNPRNP